MNINRRNVATLLLSTSLIVSLLFFNFNLPLSVSGSPELIFLHGPPLVPIHMDLNESLVPVHMNSYMTLTPVHMHFVGPWWVEDPIYTPLYTEWHELYPKFCQYWNLTSHVDTDGDEMLSPNDQIDMTDEAGNVTWYHVDRITWTLYLMNEFMEEMFIEFKGPPETKDPILFPICTYWHEVRPSYCNVYHIVNASGPLEYCTTIEIEKIIDGVPSGEITVWHVEDVARDIILREKIMDPRCTWWHEIYPDYCKWYHLTSWEEEVEDPYSDMLSPCDQIDMTDEETGNKTWYHVDRMTIALNVTLEKEPTEWMKIELKTYYFDEMYNALKHPVDTLWHEVYPDYSNLYALTWWDWWEDDNCNGVLDVCDYIWLYDYQTGIEDRYHVEDICYDIILNKKIMDPRCTWWYEVARAPYSLEPPFNLHHLTSWEETADDPYPGRLSPCDQIDMYDEESGETKWYHVDRVTLTLNVTQLVAPDFYYLFEYKGPFEYIYWVKTHPIESLWHLVWPTYYFDPAGIPITAWEDNCNGVLDRCDNITLGGVPCHVEDLAIDIILNEKITDPFCTYWREIPEYYWEIPPEYWNEYHIVGWEDNDDGLLSYCDTIEMTLLPDGPTKEYHVEYVTLTLNISDPYYPEEWYLVEYYYEGPVENMYWVKTHPIGSWWYDPPWFGEPFQIEDWIDNCNGVLDYCDEVVFDGYSYHVEGLSIDIVVGPPPIHDVAVDHVVSLKDWVYQGQIDPISVTVTNYGDYTETVDVYAFYDGTQAATKQTVVLNPGNTQKLTFNWDTTGVPPGFYTVSANAIIPIDDVPGNNYLTGNEQEVRELPPPPEDLELYPREVVDLEIPLDTQWHELHPSKTNYYHLIDWLPGTVLGPEDWVLMDDIWFLVDDLTIDIEVLDTESGITYWLDYECGYWTFNLADPVCTKWNEIKNSETHMPPEWPRCWHLTEWYDDNEDGILSYCDYVVMTPNDPYPGAPHLFHVELVTVTLKLTDEGIQQHYLEFSGTLEEFKAMDLIHFPYETMWKEIWPDQGRPWWLVDWEDMPYLAPSDQILLMLKDPETHELIPGTEAEYHVDKVTVAMNLTNEYTEMTHIVKFEGSLVQFKYHYWMYDPPYSEGPYGTQWHEVNPTYCRQWHLLYWDDDGDYILDFCDYILLVDKETGEEVWFHVESLSTDIYVSTGIHDVAVTDAVTFKTVCTVTYHPINVVYENYTVWINATVENQGDFAETFDVTAKYDGNTIQTIPDISLSAHTSTNVIFTWDTTGVAKGTYTISVEAEIVSGETETGDNTLTDGTVTVTWLGDLGGDFDVDEDDLWDFCTAFIDYWKTGVKDPRCDLDDDCDIDEDDLWDFCAAFIEYWKSV